MMTELTALWAGFKLNAVKFFMICGALLAPIQFVLLLVGAFIMADTIAGIWCAKRTGKKITSNKLSKFISKMLVYQSVVILVYALDVLLLGEFFLAFISVKLLLTKVISIALIINEVYSIDEKIVNVKGKGIFSYLKKLLGLAKLVKKQTAELMDKDKED